MNRVVEWDGFFNARDLGGLELVGGGSTVPARVFRSATLRFASAVGWKAAWSAGVRTILDLRNDDEVDPRDAAPTSGSALFTEFGRATFPPAEMDTIRVALDDVDDVELWSRIRSEGLDGTPLYYRLFVERKAERCADAVRAVARARPGGVLFHCGAGRDRTGLIALLLLAIVGVSKEAIAADYALSAPNLSALFAAMDVPDEGPAVELALRAHAVTVGQAVVNALDGLDAEAVLRGGGLSDVDLAAARGRLLS